MAQALSAVPSQGIVYSSWGVGGLCHLVVFFLCCHLIRFIPNLPILSRLETRHPAQIQVEKFCQ